MTSSTQQASAYKAAVVKILTKTMQLSHPSKIIDQDAIAEPLAVWLDTFQEIIPIEDISPAWKRALSTHASSFPVNAFDILKAFHELRDERAKKALAREEAERKENPVKFCEYKKTHINEFGDVEEVIGGPDGIDVILPCPYCRKNAYQIRYAEEKAKYAAQFGQQPKETAAIVMQLFTDKRKEKYRTMNAVEILDSLINRVGLECANSRDDISRGQLHRAYASLINAKAFVSEMD